MDPSFAVYTNGKAEPKWKEWSIDITPASGGRKWPKHTIGAFDYQSNQKPYQKGYEWWDREKMGQTECAPWSPEGNSPIDKFVTKTNAVGEHKVCWATVKFPSSLKPGVHRIRYHMYNYQNESHWSQMLFVKVGDSKDGPSSGKPSTKTSANGKPKDNPDKSNPSNGCIVTIDRSQYDVTAFRPSHPGGAEVIKCNSDISASCKKFHQGRCASLAQQNGKRVSGKSSAFVIPADPVESTKIDVSQRQVASINDYFTSIECTLETIEEKLQQITHSFNKILYGSETDQILNNTADRIVDDYDVSNGSTDENSDSEFQQILYDIQHADQEEPRPFNSKISY